MDDLLKYLESEFTFYSNLIEKVQDQLFAIEENELFEDKIELMTSYDELTELIEDYEIKQGQVQDQIDELMDKIGITY